MARTKRPINARCVWREDDDGVWATSCGNLFQFDVDGPSENKFTHCPYCGAHLKAEAIKAWGAQHP